VSQAPHREDYTADCLADAVLRAVAGERIETRENPSSTLCDVRRNLE
jgi:hypothetical protein